MKSLSMKYLFNLIAGLSLILFGLFLLVLYVVLRTKADNWFIAFAVFLFLFGLGVGAIALGVRRIMLLSRNPINNHNKE